jgi:hypothetical protein
MSSLFADRQYIIHIDSSNRISGDHQDGFYKVPIKNGRIQDYDRCVMLSATIPKSYYNIQEGFNTFVVDENSTLLTITIPIGNYSAKGFASVVQGLINSESASSGASFTYSMTFDNVSGKYSYQITAGNAGFLPVSIVTTTNVFESLGFNPNTTNSFASNSLISTTVIDLSPEANLFIRSDMVNNAESNDDILQDIQTAQVPQFGRAGYYLNTNPEAYSKLLNNTTDIYRFYITDETLSGDGKIINLNDRNWNCSILLYKKGTFSTFIKDSIKFLIESFT